ncbi:hypothetical protein [Saccharomonospora sp. CUA-673]|uniref:hypothetical protein n=1 Tax=Saccharomonospora sp. CUA-673 TaxID=1904969 RepID=UPI00130157A5|nr:hypothetical protein [Saccharomonospora sp. CUA-673]
MLDVDRDEDRSVDVRREVPELRRSDRGVWLPVAAGFGQQLQAGVCPEADLVGLVRRRQFGPVGLGVDEQVEPAGRIAQALDEHESRAVVTL